MSANKATLKSYLDQWSEYFEGLETEEELLTRLRNFAFDGRLRSCKFRSICWRIFLRCLPCQTDKWKERLEKSRERYVEIKNKYVTKPSSETKAKDVAVDNPLSQSDQSSWNQFFKNTDLKKTIERDVKRTFPEMEYFHDEKVHKLLVDILFCYAQEHSDLLYRQGMHELLAPLVFIIHCDLQAACHGREIGSLTEHINLVLDKKYLEHDAYDMFCHLMESTNPWYSVTERGKREEAEEEGITENENGVETENSSIQTVPFQPQEIATSGGPTLAITNKLNHIHNTLLVQHDLQLHTHLNRLEIIPQVFGLRWIRLLFGREFSLQDLLVLWDATFADSSTLDLVDYLFVAMLINIRHLLLNADYSSCMQILMKYPPIDDINDIVQAAKDIRVLKGRSFSDSFKENITPAPSGNKMSKSERSLKLQSTPQGSINKQNSFTKMFKDLTRKVMPENKPPPPIPSHMKDPTYAGHIGSPPQMQSAVTGRWNTNGTPAYFKQIPPLTEAPRAEEILRKHPGQLERELILLHQEMNRMQQMCRFCSDKVAACVTVLQSNVSSTVQDDQSSSSAANETSDSTSMEKNSTEVEQDKFENEQILVTVASLKQIRDILNGTLTFNPNLQEYTGRRKHEAENGAVEIRAPQSVVNIIAEAGDT